LETKESGRISEEIDEQAVADSCSAWWSSGTTGPYGGAPVSLQSREQARYVWLNLAKPLMVSFTSGQTRRRQIEQQCVAATLLAR
jgi:hypothetical protein